MASSCTTLTAIKFNSKTINDRRIIYILWFYGIVYKWHQKLVEIACEYMVIFIGMVEPAISYHWHTSPTK
jgi:hypothetical protein